MITKIAYDDIKPFFGARGQVLLPWLQLLRSRANLLHNPDADIAREFCLKLEGPAPQSYNQGFAADASPTFAAVAAHLSKFYERPSCGGCSSGSDARQAALARRPSNSCTTLGKGA
jgi:hypothetical protein